MVTALHAAEVLLDVGGPIFALLGLLHAVYTYLDIRRPRRLVPRDPAVALAMANSPLRISGTETTVWKAWVGFNFSHSLGVMLFGALCCCVAAALGILAVPAWGLILLTLIALTYFGLSLRYWFRIPSIGTGIGAALILAASLLYVFGA
jgi:hypothetical protein